MAIKSRIGTKKLKPKGGGATLYNHNSGKDMLIRPLVARS